MLLQFGPSKPWAIGVSLWYHGKSWGRTVEEIPLNPSNGHTPSTGEDNPGKPPLRHQISCSGVCARDGILLIHT